MDYFKPASLFFAKAKTSSNGTSCMTCFWNVMVIGWSAVWWRNLPPPIRMKEWASGNPSPSRIRWAFGIWCVVMFFFDPCPPNSLCTPILERTSCASTKMSLQFWISSPVKLRMACGHLTPIFRMLRTHQYTALHQLSFSSTWTASSKYFNRSQFLSAPTLPGQENLLVLGCQWGGEPRH